MKILTVRWETSAYNRCAYMLSMLLQIHLECCARHLYRREESPKPGWAASPSQDLMGLSPNYVELNDARIFLDVSISFSFSVFHSVYLECALQGLLPFLSLIYCCRVSGALFYLLSCGTLSWMVSLIKSVNAECSFSRYAVPSGSCMMSRLLT